MVVVLFVEWWAIWFTLGRNFSTTTTLTAIANGASFGLAALFIHSGALGYGGGGFWGWLVALALVWIWNTGLECFALRVWMRRRRSQWRWNSFDLAVVAGANFLAPLLGFFSA
ncbi:MAG: hypothetical protein QGH51_09870 [Planctomycetota bacterium]|nr:hypothetical protein [Planctomycetota bacterium]MDP6942317.1 hypothetical protein [Planctomycetota bacterium]